MKEGIILNTLLNNKLQYTFPGNEMKPLNIEIIKVWYRRPGLTKVKFSANYGNYSRRGTMTFDTVNQKFLSHRQDAELLFSICKALQSTSRREVGY